MPLFDRNELTVLPLAERVSDMGLADLRPMVSAGEVRPALATVAERMLRARAAGGEVIMMIGGHVVRAGVQRHLIDLLERGLITCLAMNGACAVHDWELALTGRTTESVARYLREGQFGLWKETAGINDAVNEGFARGAMGLGEAVGAAIGEGAFPHKEISLLAACHRLRIPATVHIGIGFDINQMHPNFDPAAAAVLSYRDFLRFAQVTSALSDGVLMNFGSAVTGPEVFLKALAMARNAAHPGGGGLTGFTTLVCDLLDLPERPVAEAPRDDPRYYFRPWKTILVRAVEGGGEGFYVRGDHRETVPELWTALTRGEGGAA